MHPSVNTVVKILSRLRSNVQTHAVVLSEVTLYKRVPRGVVISSAHYGTSRCLCSSGCMS